MHLLIIRFSSFGDIAQTTAAALAFRNRHPEAKISWLVRSDFAEYLSSLGVADHVIAFDRRESAWALWQRAQGLALGQAATPITHVFDAHCNLRSRIVRAAFFLKRRRPLIKVRGKNRFRRFLLFHLRYNTFPSPFRAAESFLWPLRGWQLEQTAPPLAPPLKLLNHGSQLVSRLGLPKDFTILVPSAAWPLKRWPLSAFTELVRRFPQEQFVVLGGKDDRFAETISSAAPSRVHLLLGKLRLEESVALLTQAKAVLSNDTGLFHVADALNIPSVGLIGPSAFGYPARTTSLVAETHLSCKPCSKDGRDRCRNPRQQACMQDLSLNEVQALLNRALGASK